MSGDGPDGTLVDARGLRCPAPVIALARAARAAEGDDLVVLLADDPAAVPDVAAWCRMRGHTLVEAGPERFVVRVSRTPAAAGGSAPS